MRILQLTPGTGSFLCGSCLRDNTLARALIRQGHEATIAPLYLPFVLEDEGEGRAASETVRMGGINVYLHQKLPWLRLPRFAARLLDSPRLLRAASSHAGGMTHAAALGEMTLSMLRGEEGRQAADLGKLVEWMRSIEHPDVVILSNAMLIGLARRIREELDCPVLCTLQGEAPFLDALHEPHRELCWSTLASRAADVDAFIAVSRFTAELMGERMGVAPERVEVVPNGIDLHGFEPAHAAPGRPTIGYLARMCADKGLPMLVDAFLALRKRGRVPDVRLLAGGVMLSEDEPLVRELEARVRAAGAADAVELRPNLSREEKIELLRSVSLLSVPAMYGESFGLYLLEAMACGVPVVQPRHGGFPEIVAATGGGLVFDPNEEGAFETALEELLSDEERARAFGARGRESVLASFTADRMAENVHRVCAAMLEDASR